MRRYLSALLLAVPAAVMASLPPSLDQAVQRISADDANNRVLNQLQAATLALDLGNRELAGELFDAALATITSVYADSEQAARAAASGTTREPRISRVNPTNGPWPSITAGCWTCMPGITRTPVPASRAGCSRMPLPRRSSTGRISRC